MLIRDFTPHRYSIALRSTNVTLDISRAIWGADSGFNAFASSGTYSPVSCPHRCTVRALLSFCVVVIFSTNSVPAFSGPSYTAELVLVDLQRTNSRLQG